MTSGPGLDGPSHPPAAGGPPRQLVILLHGLGADGNDLIDLAPRWAPLLPDAEFLSPHAPFPFEGAPFGRQWFRFDPRFPEDPLPGVQAAAPLLDRFIDEALASRGLTPDRLALVGFSQGAMMALHVGLRRAPAVAGILAYSGALIGPEVLGAEMRSAPPVLLVHGDADQVVGFGWMDLARRGLAAAGIPVRAVARPGLAHGIDEEGLDLGGAFLARHLLAQPIVL